MNTFLKSTIGWAMIFCLLAAISPAFPWGYQWGYESFSGLMHPTFPNQIRIPYSAYADWHGAALSITGGVGLLFLVATGGIKPAPWWRTLSVAIIGIAVITITIIFSTRKWNHFPVSEYGGLLAIISSTGLLFTACIEVRQILERGANVKPAAPVEPPTVNGAG